jgi:hypothetical protein
METLMLIFDQASHVVLILVAVATAIVRVTPTKSDDEKLQKVLDGVHKFCAYCPTLGVNPKTKELLNAVLKSNDLKS